MWTIHAQPKIYGKKKGLKYMGEKKGLISCKSVKFFWKLVKMIKIRYEMEARWKLPLYTVGHMGDKHTL